MANNALFDNLFRRISSYDDQVAFKELFFDFYPSLCVFAQRYISSLDVCEDIVQETFFRLWKNRKIMEVNSSFRNFLVTSVKNSCMDYLRKQSVRELHADRQLKSNTSNNYADETPETIYTIKELEDILHAALDKLPVNIRKAFQLSRFENLTYNQIAQEMSVSQKTVEAYISKALIFLRTELKDFLPVLILIYGSAFFD